MISLIINMHIRPLHIGQTLKLNLQLLGHIMSSAQSGLWIHDDVDFDDEAGTAVVGADGVDLEDVGGVCHCFCMLVRQHIKKWKEEEKEKKPPQI